MICGPGPSRSAATPAPSSSPTCVVLGHDVGTPEQRTTVTRLAGMNPEQVDMRTLVIIGSSTTRVVRRGDGTAVLTLRHHG